MVTEESKRCGPVGFADTHLLALTPNKTTGGNEVARVRDSIEPPDNKRYLGRERHEYIQRKTMTGLKRRWELVKTFGSARRGKGKSFGTAEGKNRF